MNNFIICIIIFGSSIAYSRTYGKGIYDRNSYLKSGFFEQTIEDAPYQAIEISTDVNEVKNPISLQDAARQGVLNADKKLHPVKVNTKYKVNQASKVAAHDQETNSLSTKIDNYLVKVSSVDHSKASQVKLDTGGSKTRLPLKFNHVIEIIQQDKDNEFEKTEPAPEVSTKTVNSDITTWYETLEKDTTSQQPFESKSNADSTNIENEDNAGRAGESEDITLTDQFDGSGEEMSSNDKSGRVLSIFSRQNDSSPVCTTPKGEKGHCRRFSHCLLSDVLNNFNVFLQYMCLIRGALVGVCCPDNPVIEITNPDENSTESGEATNIRQPPEGCGLNVKTRIVGGTISVPHEWSWMVALMRRNRFYCGGVIINNWYVLTAAHCVMGIQVKDLTVRLGEYNFSANNEHKEDISVAEIKRHAQFVTLTFQHDIALIKLRRSIQYSKFVGSICLPTSTARDYSDGNGTVVGWGTVSFGGAASPILRQVTIPVWKNEDCDRTYLLENIDDSFMCAGSPEKGEDACQGDSGGPLMTLNDRSRWEVIGIVSWGRRCGDPTYPGVYTRITTYVDWITQNVN